MRAMQFKEEITLIKRKNCSILEYLHAVKALADKITLIDHPISDDDLNFYILNGLSFDFKDITASIRQICLLISDSDDFYHPYPQHDFVGLPHGGKTIIQNIRSLNCLKP
jgi:hypothetical protein